MLLSLQRLPAFGQRPCMQWSTWVVSYLSPLSELPGKLSQKWDPWAEGMGSVFGILQCHVALSDSHVVTEMRRGFWKQDSISFFLNFSLERRPLPPSPLADPLGGGFPKEKMRRSQLISLLLWMKCVLPKGHRRFHPDSTVCVRMG